MQEILSQLLEAWATNNRVNLYLIDHISAEGLKCTLSKRGGRNVCRQFAHLHNVRVWHLERRAGALAAGLYKFATREEPDKETLKKHLSASAQAVARFLENCLTGQGKQRCFKKGAIAQLSYFIAHDSHHRGNILLTLKQCGHNLDQAERYAIWDWDRL